MAAAAETIHLTGGHGPAHLILEVIGALTLYSGIGMARDLPLSVTVRSWFEGEPDHELLESLKRELLRSAGYPEWEG